MSRNDEQLPIGLVEGIPPCSNENQRKDFGWGSSVTGTVPQTDFGFNLQASLLIPSTTKRYQSIAGGRYPVQRLPPEPLVLTLGMVGNLYSLGLWIV